MRRYPRPRPLRWLAFFAMLAVILAWAAALRWPSRAVAEVGEALRRPASARAVPSEAPSNRVQTPNEAGQIMILTYHRFSPQPGDWNRTPQDFRRDLETLYRQGYRLLSLHDLLSGRITTPRGFTPVVLTFDDGWQSQFNYLAGPKGEVKLDPESAVGILAEFVQRHPDMGSAGTFYLNANPFGQPALARRKLRYLVSHGFELGNHTLNHANLRRTDPAAGARELAQLAMLISALVPGYRLETMALPFGAAPHDPRVAREGAFDGTAYRHRAVLLVGANPAPSPYAEAFDPFKLPRIQANGQELDRWLEYFQAHPERRFISDGDPATVTVPPDRAGEIDLARLKAERRRLATLPSAATPGAGEQTWRGTSPTG